LATFQSGGVLVTRATAGAATVTATLDTPPAGMCNKILWITCFATSATVANVDIQKNDATSIAKLGGVGTSILNQPLYFGDVSQPRGGVCGAAADATLVVLTTTSGNPTTISVGYTMVPA
jgi:hypothetical protein